MPILSCKTRSLETRGRINNTCVRIAMLYGSECWPLKRTDLFQLKRNVREINVTAVMPHIDRKFLRPQHSLQQAGFD